MSARILVAADYSQLEVRIAGFVSRDPILMSIANSTTWPSNDLHAQTMQRVFGIAFEEQGRYPHIRVSAKTQFFGALYGAGPDTLVLQIEKAALSNPKMNIPVPTKQEAMRSLRQIHEVYEKF